MTLDELNRLPGEEARAALLACCGSKSWTENMLASRPFYSVEQLHQRGEELWLRASRQDWLEAFSKHPKIGENSGGKWSAQEQRGMDKAKDGVAGRMRALNVEYEAKFGWIFIICATGKSGEEMLAALSQRLLRDRESELTTAAAEQAKIMHLRLEKLLAP